MSRSPPRPERTSSGQAGAESALACASVRAPEVELGAPAEPAGPYARVAKQSWLKQYSASKGLTSTSASSVDATLLPRPSWNFACNFSEQHGDVERARNANFSDHNFSNNFRIFACWNTRLWETGDSLSRRGLGALAMRPGVPSACQPGRRDLAPAARSHGRQGRSASSTVLSGSRCAKP